jgi:hypothetical protein
MRNITIFTEKSSFSQKEIMHEQPSNCKPLGYRALVDLYEIEAFPHYRWSFVAAKGARETIKDNNIELHIYPKSYLIKDETNPFRHIEFALKHEGIHLQILQDTFAKLQASDVECYIKTQPTSKYARITWFLYETLLKQKLDIPDAKRGSYFELLDPNKYYCSLSRRSQRHRIKDNLLGNFMFCPFVRKTSTIESCIEKKLDQRAEELLKQYPPLTIARAMRFLYTKETLSSYEIEREEPSKKRLLRFVDILKDAEKLKELDKQKLVYLQENILESRFCNKDYRNFQNYVGEISDTYREKIHFIPPKPDDVEGLMEGLLQSLERMVDSRVPAPIIAAAISFGFVYIHPFEDGNGRLHRFIIHYILARGGFSPNGVIFPISAVMLKDLKAYDEVLEKFSIPLLKQLKNYSVTEDGELQVEGETKDYYRFIDFTQTSEYLFQCIEETILSDFKEELNYIVKYDIIKKGIQNIVDIPDRKIDLLIKFVLQNPYKLSSKKRDKYFSSLSDREIKEIVSHIEDCSRI